MLFRSLNGLLPTIWPRAKRNAASSSGAAAIKCALASRSACAAGPWALDERQFVLAGSGDDRFTLLRVLPRATDNMPDCRVCAFMIVFIFFTPVS